MCKTYLAIALIVFVFSTGCAKAAFINRPVVFGLLYAQTSAPESATGQKSGTKRGQACMASVLGLVTWGDASSATAARNGGVGTVATVDNEYTDVLGIYSHYCINVTGE